MCLVGKNLNAAHKSHLIHHKLPTGAMPKAPYFPRCFTCPVFILPVSNLVNEDEWGRRAELEQDPSGGSRFAGPRAEVCFAPSQ